MKRTLLLAICTSILTVLATQLAFGNIALGRSASAVIPEIISYQGILNDNDGNPLNGNYDLTVRIYNQESGGSALWEETHTDVAVNNGLFDTMLGTVNPLSVAFDEPYYSGLSINGGDELTPRLAFASVATAFVAKVAYTLAPDADGNITLDGEAIISGGLKPDWDSGWVYETNSSTHLTEKTHNLGVYPTRCMVWFSPSNPPNGDIYPYGSCWNNPLNISPDDHEYQNPLGWAVNETRITWSIWHGTNLFKHYDASEWHNWDEGYFRVLLWK